MNNNSINDKLKEQEFDEKISADFKQLGRKEPPFNLWYQIEEKLKLEKISGNIVEIRPKKRYFPELMLSYKKYALGFTIFLVLFVISYLIFFSKNDESSTKLSIIVNSNTSKSESIAEELSKSSITKKPGIQVKSIVRKRNTEIAIPSFDTSYYQKKINVLTASAENKKNKLDPYLMTIYNEKLAAIDESIIDCKSNLENNNLNSLIRNSLLTAYGEKVKLLLDIINN